MEWRDRCNVTHKLAQRYAWIFSETLIEWINVFDLRYWTHMFCICLHTIMESISYFHIWEVNSESLWLLNLSYLVNTINSGCMKTNEYSSIFCSISNNNNNNSIILSYQNYPFYVGLRIIMQPYLPLLPKEMPVSSRKWDAKVCFHYYEPRIWV